MSRIPDDVLEAIRHGVDIVDLVGRYVPLKRAGRGFKARCPFHEDSDPSLHIWAETGTWKCFVCDIGGNAFHFLMQKEGMTFPEAVRKLAEETGVKIEAESPTQVRQRGRMERLRDLHEFACRFFQAGLWGPAGTVAREYFKARGITGETARSFRLGFARSGWDHLLRGATDAGYSEDELVEAGLVVRREPESPGGRVKLYDRFRDRVVFPIADPQGRVIAFGARTLGDDKPKYLNSPETPLYTKGRHLYALHLAKDAMMRTGEGAVMEGYTDVLMAHQAGWPVAVAGLGTALTPQQAERLARYVKKLWLLYDGDEAGLRAAEKAAAAFLPEEIETRVAVLPIGSDPADVITAGGVEALRVHLDEGREAFDHVLAARMEAHDMQTVPGRTKAIEEALEVLSGVGNSIKRSLYVRRLADELGVPVDDAAGRLAELVERRARRVRRPQRPDAQRPAAPRPTARPAARPKTPTPRDMDPNALLAQAAELDTDGFEGTAVPTETARTLPAASAAPAEAVEGPPSNVEALLLEALLGSPAVVERLAPHGAAVLGHSGCRELASRLLEMHAAGETPDGDALISRLQDPGLASLAVGLRDSGAGMDLERQGQDCLARIVEQRRGRGLHAAFREADGADAEADALRRLVEFHRRRASGSDEAANDEGEAA